MNDFGKRWRAACALAVASVLAACGSGNDTTADARPALQAASLATAKAVNDGLTLPLEVLGNGSPAAPVVAEARLGVAPDRLGAVAQLWFQCHRCGFYGAPEFEATTALPVKIKASIRFLGGAGDDSTAPWIDVTDANVVLADDERLHGGINGGFYTTRITLPLDAAAKARLVALPGMNRIQFRFNGTDGESNGYRILNLQLQDAGAAQVDTTTVQRFDPLSERGTANLAQADIDAGKALWYAHGSNAKSAIVTRKLQAACASCHADNGRDLQYFNYSNNAIVQRSRFHGLSDTQGAQIAAFLRASLKDVPYVGKARPWNPPYQPGPGLDCTTAACATEWSAGAGLEAVLPTPADAMKALFGQPLNAPLALTQADIDRVMNPNATMNVRETAIAMQFPDWNAWLPTTHPLDIWPTTADGSGFTNGIAHPNEGWQNPNGRYHDLINWFEQHKNPNGNRADYSHLIPDLRVQISSMMTFTGWDAYKFLGGGRGNHIADNGQQYGAQRGAAYLQTLANSTTMAAAKPRDFTTNAFIERSVASMLHWNAVKQWELAQDYQLEGNQTWFIGDKDQTTGQWQGRGEAHGWPFQSVSLFFLAPHMVYQEDKNTSGKITREWHTAWEADNIVGSYYRSNQWYQLQMTVNPGGQSGWVNYPMDWPYLTAFDEYIGDLVGNATPAARALQNSHNIRLLQGRIKGAQYVNNDIPIWDPNGPTGYNNAARYGRAQIVKHLATANFLDKATREGVQPARYRFLDELQPGLYLKTVNGAIGQFNALYTWQPVNAWRRCDPANTELGEPENVAGFRYCLDQAKTPLGQYSNGDYYMITNNLGQMTTEQTEQYGLWKAKQMGAEPARLKVWRDWTGAVWP
jgi:cytochrome c553